MVVAYIWVRHLPLYYPVGRMVLNSLHAFWYFAVIALIVALVAAAIPALKNRKEAHWTQALLKSNAVSPAYWFEFLRICAACIGAGIFHFLLKASIYVINPRTWDKELFQLDQTIHFGISPSLFFVELFHSPYAYAVIDFVYSRLYFYVQLFYPILFLTLGKPNLRKSFATSYVLLFIFGLLAYVLLPSWGPVFTMPDEFQDALQHMPATMVVQNHLYQETVSLVTNPGGPRVIQFGGIAAFPSLHIGLLVLFCFYARRISKIWFRFSILFLMAMFVGSLVTGYHYLVDGYAGALLAALCVLIAEKVSKMSAGFQPA